MTYFYHPRTSRRDRAAVFARVLVAQILDVADFDRAELIADVEACLELEFDRAERQALARHNYLDP